jgi:hypothetical protein
MASVGASGVVLFGASGVVGEDGDLMDILGDKFWNFLRR